MSFAPGQTFDLSLSNPNAPTLGTPRDTAISTQDNYGNHPIITVYDTGVDATGVPPAVGATDRMGQQPLVGQTTPHRHL